LDSGPPVQEASVFALDHCLQKKPIKAWWLATVLFN